MRLSVDLVNELSRILKSFSNSKPFELFLYGSRIHDNLAGGDIDLLLVVGKDDFDFFRQNELKILAAMHSSKIIGDRRIDFKVAKTGDEATDAFVKSIWEEKLKIG